MEFSLYSCLVKNYRCFILSMPTAGELSGEKEETLFCLCGSGESIDQVPREVVKWAVRKLGVNEWLIRAVMTMYRNNINVIRINNTMGYKIDVKVMVHQDFVLSPLLFVIFLKPF